MANSQTQIILSKLRERDARRKREGYITLLTDGPTNFDDLPAIRRKYTMTVIVQDETGQTMVSSIRHFDDMDEALATARGEPKREPLLAAWSHVTDEDGLLSIPPPVAPSKRPIPARAISFGRSFGAGRVPTIIFNADGSLP
jgi:hypothetical protein